MKNEITSDYESEIIAYQNQLDYAHQSGLNSISSRIIQFPNDENNNTCVCEATVTTNDGKQFSDIGDASPDTVPSEYSKHVISFASTRAKSRVLSDAFNFSNKEHNDSNMIDVTPIQNSVQQNKNILSLSQNSKYTNAEKSKFNGGGSKTISQKQIGFINKLASQKNATGNDFSESMFNKSIEFLTGQEADILIKKLKN